MNESTTGPIAEATEADSAGTQPLPPVAAVKPSTVPLVDYPAPSDRTPAWYANWLATTKLEERDRQSAVLHLLATGQAFFRAEVIEQLNRRVDPTSPIWTTRPVARIACSAS